MKTLRANADDSLQRTFFSKIYGSLAFRNFFRRFCFDAAPLPPINSSRHVIPWLWWYHAYFTATYGRNAKANRSRSSRRSIQVRERRRKRDWTIALRDPQMILLGYLDLHFPLFLSPFSFWELSLLFFFGVLPQRIRGERFRFAMVDPQLYRLCLYLRLERVFFLTVVVFQVLLLIRRVSNIDI